MAIISKTGTRDFSEQKVSSISSAVVVADDFIEVINEVDGTTTTTKDNSLVLFKIPEKSLITAITLIVADPSDAPLKLSVTVDDVDYPEVVAVECDTEKTATWGNFANWYHLPMGGNVKLIPDTDVEGGEYVVMVKYVEYTRGVRTLTEY